MAIRPRILLALVVLAVAGCGGGGSKDTSTRTVTPGEFGQNAVRIGGRSGADVAAEAVLAAYPPSKDRRPSGWVVVPQNDWRAALLGAQFGGTPLNGGLVSTARRFLPTPTQDVMARYRSDGFPRAKGIDTLVIGAVGQDVSRSLTDLHLEIAQVKARDAASLARELVPYRGGFAHGYTSQVVVVSDEQRDYALPAGAWSAYSGDTIAFAGRDRVPAATRSLLVQRKKLRAERPTIYVVGPESVISAGVARELAQYGPVERIAGRGPIETAIAFARYRDKRTGFGWGLVRGPANVSLMDTRHPDDALGAYQFAATSPQAPLLLTSSAGELPPPVRRYIEQLRGARPNQGFVFGGEDRISSKVLAELDKALAAR
jgi:hypothetical protein